MLEHLKNAEMITNRRDMEKIHAQAFQQEVTILFLGLTFVHLNEENPGYIPLHETEHPW